MNDFERSHTSIVTVMVSFDRYLPSINDFIGKNRHAYNTSKRYWSEILEHALYGEPGELVIRKPDTKTKTERLEVTRDGELEGQFARIDVDGHVVYPKRNVGPRDQGNARGFLEKVLGDVFEKHGHFKKDDNWDAYSFGGFERSYLPGVSRTDLQIIGRRLIEPLDMSASAQENADVLDVSPPSCKVSIG